MMFGKFIEQIWLFFQFLNEFLETLSCIILNYIFEVDNFWVDIRMIRTAKNLEILHVTMFLPVDDVLNSNKLS